MSNFRDAVVFNNSTGSDSNSGLGPSTIFSASVAGASSTSVSVLSVTTGTLASLQAGDCAYMSGNSGTKFNIVSSVDSFLNTINFSTPWQSTANRSIASDVTPSGGSIVIGGARQTLDHADSKELIGKGSLAVSGDVAKIEATGTAYTLTSKLEVGGFKLLGALAGVQTAYPLITCNFTNAGIVDMVPSGWHYYSSQISQKYQFEKLRLSTTADRSVYLASDRPLIDFTGATAGGVSFTDCVFNENVGAGKSADTVFENNSSGFLFTSFENCVFHVRSHASSSASIGAYLVNAQKNTDFKGCRFVGSNKGATGASIAVFGSSSSSSFPSTSFFGCSFDGCYYGMFPQEASLTCVNSAFYDNATAVHSGSVKSAFYGNIFHSNTSVFASSGNATKVSNGFYNDTAVGDSPYTFSSDPFTNASGGDYSLTQAAYTEVASSPSSFGSAVTNGAPPLEMKLLRGLDLSTGGGSGAVRITMNGGIDG